MKSFNFIFTGKYLILWYIAFVVTISLMVFNFARLRAVDEYTLYIYDDSGQLVETQTVTRGEINQYYLSEYPVSKLFVPNK